MKIIVEPQAMTWQDAMAFAKYRKARLPKPMEIQQIAKSRSLTVDVWTNEENQDEPSFAKCWSRKYQAVKSKEKSKFCLLLMIA